MSWDECWTSGFSLFFAVASVALVFSHQYASASASGAFSLVYLWGFFMFRELS